MGQICFPNSQKVKVHCHPCYETACSRPLLLLGSSVLQTPAVFLRDEQLPSGPSPGPIDKRWVRVSRLTPRPHCLSEFRQVAATSVLTLFSKASRVTFAFFGFRRLWKKKTVILGEWDRTENCSVIISEVCFIWSRFLFLLLTWLEWLMLSSNSALRGSVDSSLIQRECPLAGRC